MIRNILQFIKSHLMIHVAAFILLGSVFFVELLLSGEIFYDYALDSTTLPECLYSFDVNNITEENITCLTNEFSHSEIRVVSRRWNEKIIFVSYIGEIDKRRGSNLENFDRSKLYINSEYASLISDIET